MRHYVKISLLHLRYANDGRSRDTEGVRSQRLFSHHLKFSFGINNFEGTISCSHSSRTLIDRWGYIWTKGEAWRHPKMTLWSYFRRFTATISFYFDCRTELMVMILKNFYNQSGRYSKLSIFMWGLESNYQLENKVSLQHSTTFSCHEK